MHIELKKLGIFNDLNQLVDDSFNGTCFAYDWFLMLKKVDYILVILNNKGNMVGFMPLFIDENDQKKLAQSTMYIPYGGPVLFQLPTKERHKIKFIRDIEYQLAKYLKGNFTTISFSTDTKIKDIMPFIRVGYIPEVRYTYKLDLQNTLDEIYINFGSDRKKEIRKMNALGVEIICDSNLEYFDCEKAMKWEKKHNLPSSSDFVKKYILTSISKNRGMSFVLKKDKEILGGVHLVWDKTTAYILYSYYENKGAITTIYYNMIKYLKENTTVKFLDFEGSVYESIEDFNMSFGAFQDRYYNLHWKDKNIEELYTNLYEYGDK